SLLRACGPTPLIGRTAGGRAFRTHGRTFCWAFGTHGGTFGPANVGPLGPISWSLGPARSRAFSPPPWSVRSACAGSIRSARARSFWPAWPRTVWSNAWGSTRSRTIWSKARTIRPRATTRTIRTPDARRPCAWAEWGTPIGRRRLPYWRIDPDLIPAAIIPAPTIVPARTDEHSCAEDQSPG